MKPEGKWKSFHEKLTAVYLNELSSGKTKKPFVAGSNLLQKLMWREKLNCLVVNLYPGNEGYSLMLRTKSGSNAETIRLPYEECELLNYIDNEELPPLLVDLLERSQAGVFYSGCLIVEVRDYRRSSNPAAYEHRYVLLRPTTQSVLSDVSALTSEDPQQHWTWEERQALESHMLLATSEPLCLDPNIQVTLKANRIQHKRLGLSTPALQRLSRRHSQSAVNRKRRFEHCLAPPQLRLFDFLARHKRKIKPIANLKMTRVVDSWKQKELALTAPESLEIDSLATTPEKPKLATDNTPIPMEDYILEAERGSGKVQVTQVSILQRPTDLQFLGQLSIHREGQDAGTTCWFPLGHQSNVDKYISQFMEIFTEEGRKSVKITHSVPGKSPEVSFTPQRSSGIGNTTNAGAATTPS